MTFREGSLAFRPGEGAVKRDRKVIAVEMEGYAVMRAAVHAGVPLGCMIVRSVADFADEEGPRYADFANQVCAGAVVSLLGKGLSQLVLSLR